MTVPLCPLLRKICAWRRAVGILSVLVVLTIPSGLLAQNRPVDAAPDSLLQSIDRPVRLFLDCRRCDESYLRRNLVLVNHVRDRKQADVHLFMTSQGTGGGGRTFRLEFIGRGPFEDFRYELTYDTDPTQTQDERRTGLARRIRLGLVPFVGKSPNANQLAVSYEPTSEDETTRSPQDDPWNQWVFEVSGGGRLGLEEQERSYNFEGELQAERVTRAWKLQLQSQGEYELDIFEQDSTEIRSTSEDYSFDGQVVKSLGPHWGAGSFGAVFSRTFTNIDLGLRLKPAVEYNVFPYRISDQKSLTITYRVGPEHRNYRTETIFGKQSELLVQESLEVSLELNRPWGFIFSSIEGSHYFHDLTKNRLRFDSFLRLQLIEGLSLRLSFEAQMIQDQLFLPKGEASQEEIFLRRRQLATDFELSGSVGLSYTFGSIYNNVVNTRL